MTEYRCRPMQLAEARSMIRYFLDADADYLNGMGVEPARMPSEEAWLELLQEDFRRPLKERQFYYVVWIVDGVLAGHCNINKIEFGDKAYLHLHIWNAEHRQRGCATQLLGPSICHFFEHFDLDRLFCEPYAKNPAPNRALPKAGFHRVKTYETTPGWIAFRQPVNLWVLERPDSLDRPNQRDC